MIDRVESSERALLALRNHDGREAARLVREGVDVGARDQDGCTLLLLAARRRDASLAMELLNRGADPAAADHAGMTTWWVCSEHLWGPRATIYDFAIRRGAPPPVAVRVFRALCALWGVGVIAATVVVIATGLRIGGQAGGQAMVGGLCVLLLGSIAGVIGAFLLRWVLIKSSMRGDG